MRKRSQTRLVDGMIGAYIDWREASDVVQRAYRSWGNATAPAADVAFRRYMAALDEEEWAAEAYAILVGRVGHAAMSDGDRSGHVAA